MLIERGSSVGDTISGFNFGSSNTCLSITAGGATAAVLVPIFGCTTAVNAPQAGPGLRLIGPVYAGTNAGPISSGVATIGRGALNRTTNPAVATYTAAGVDDGLSINSFAATGPAPPWGSALLTVNLPNAAAVGAGWTMGFTTAGGNALVVNAPAGQTVFAGGRQLPSITLGPGNFEVLILTSNGVNGFLTESVSQGTALYNGIQQAGEPDQFEYPAGPGYQLTQGDNGYVVSSGASAGTLALTLPSRTGLAKGWTFGIAPDGGNQITLAANATNGGGIQLANGSFVAATTFPLYAIVTIKFDGANFRLTGMNGGNLPLVGTQTAAPNVGFQFYADAVNGNDQGGSNFCPAAAPCKTLAQVVQAAYSFCNSYPPEINLLPGTYAPVQISGMPPCVGGVNGAGGTGAVVVISGAGQSNTKLVDSCSPACQFAVLNLAGGAAVATAGLSIFAGPGENGVALTGVDASFSVGTPAGDLRPVTFSGSGGSASPIHLEGQHRATFQANAVFSVGGSWQNVASLDYGANLTFDGDVTVSCLPGVTFSAGTMFTLNASTIDFGNAAQNFPGCTGGYSGFTATGGSTVVLANTTFPLAAGPSTFIGRNNSDTLFPPCVGASALCPVATAPNNWGTGAVFGPPAGNADVYGGQIPVTAGAGALTHGDIWLSFPVLLKVPPMPATAQAQCMASIGGSTWPAGSTAWVSAETLVGGNNIKISWQSPTALAIGVTYPLNWQCD